MILASLLGFALAEPLTLEQVVASADAQLPLVLLAQEQLARAEARESIARGAFDPRALGSARAQPIGAYAYGTAELSLIQPVPWTGVELTAGYRVSEGEVPAWLGALDTSTQGELYAELSAPLLGGVRIDSERAALLTAIVGVEAGEAALAQTRVAVRRDATLAWLGWVAAGQRRALVEELLALAILRDEAVARRVAVGQLPEIDRLDSQRVIPERRARLADADQELARAEAELSLYLRDPSGAARWPGRAELPAGPGAILYTPPADPVAVALANRPELTVLDASIEQAAVQLRLARSALWPKLDAKGALAVDRGYADAPLEAKVGLELSAPAWRAASGRLREAEAELAALEARRQWLEDGVEAEVLRSLAAREAALDRLEATRESEALARRLAEAEARRFELGDSDLLRVWLREQAWADAALAAISAEYEAHAAIARLVAALGESTTTR